MESSKTTSIGKLALLFLLLLLFAIWLAYDASAALTDDLQYYYKLDEISGTNAVDETNSYNATANNARVFTVANTGIIGTDANLSQGNDYITISDTTRWETKEKTVSVWVRTHSATAILRAGQSGGAGNSEGWIFATNPSSQMTLGAGSGKKLFTASHNLTGDNQYHHLVYLNTDNYAHVEFWIDGINVTNIAASGSGISAGTNAFDLGAIGSRSLFSDVNIDEFGLWNRTLSASEIEDLYNNGTGLSHPFTPPVPPTTDIEFTITNDFNGSSIKDFTVDITWENSTTQTESTTNGTIELINVTYDQNTTINVTYYGITDYFNQTLTNQVITANTSNAVTTKTYQAIASLTATELITNNSLSGVTFYIGSKSGTEFNLTAGTHTVIAEKTGYYNLTGSITVAALSNTSYTLEGMYNTIIDFTAYNAITNASVSDFTISVDFGENVSTTNGTVYINALNNSNYTYNITSPGSFTSRYNLNFTTNSSAYNVNTSLYTFNSIRFNIFNESSLNPLTQSVTVHTISNLTSFTNTTSTGFIVLDLLEPNEYEIRFESSGFNPRSIFITVLNDSTQNVTVYMTLNSSTELQRIEVLDTANQPVEGAVVWLQKELINETTQWITVQEAQTDYNGETTVWVERDVTIFYRFAVIYEGEARPIQPSDNLFTGKTTFIPGVDETIQLIIDLEDDPEDFIADDLAISFDCNMTNTTAICTILDGRNSITGAELRLEASYINESLAWESIQNDSFTGSSGTLQVNLTAINNSIWRARAYVLYEDSENLIWEDEYRFDIDVFVEKYTGILFAVLILAVVAGITVMWGPLPSSLVTFAALIPLTAIKLISIPVGVITGLLALCVIFFFRTRKNEE